MDRAAEVARIKAQYAAPDAAWLFAIRTRLEQGPATMRQLAEACGCRINGTFSGFLYALRRAGRLAVVGRSVGPTGAQFSVGMGRR